MDWLSATNARLNDKTVEGPAHGPSELYARVREIKFECKGSKLNLQLFDWVKITKNSSGWIALFLYKTCRYKKNAPGADMNKFKHTSTYLQSS